MPDSRPDHLTWRHRALIVAVALLFAALAARLVQIQIVDHDRYVEEAALTRFGVVAVAAPRGTIIDATGYPLAISIDTWDIYLDSFLWRDRERARAAAERLAPELALDAGHLFAAGTAQRQGDVLLRRGLPYGQGLAIQRLGLWGVRTLPASQRVYPDGELGAQLIGYVGLDGRGLWGIEADYDAALLGRPGRISSERDPLGRPIAFADRTERAAAPGGEMRLTVDRFMQAIIERRLAEALKEYRAPSGSILVMEPRTGAVLAMASLPTISPTGHLDDPDLPALARNRVVTDLYEPGSVLKTLTTAIALELGKVTPTSTYVDKGYVDVGPSRIRNWDFQAYGQVTVTEFLQRSLNTGAVWLSGLIGADDFYPRLRAFGIGEPTHIGLSGEAEGMLRLPRDAGWYPVDLATNAYGQGLAATPLQVLTAVNVFANGGKLMRPYLVGEIVTPQERRVFSPVEVRQVVSPATAATMAKLMEQVVEGVEYHGARVPGYHVAGKTGTTIVSISTGYQFDTTIASFAGFLPYEHPRVSILVKIDQPDGGLRLGGQVAAPVFARVAADIMEYLDGPAAGRTAAAR